MNKEDERIYRKFHGWLVAIRQQNKAIRRKNTIIKRLRRRIDELEAEMSEKDRLVGRIHNLEVAVVILQDFIKDKLCPASQTDLDNMFIQFFQASASLGGFQSNDFCEHDDE